MNDKTVKSCPLQKGDLLVNVLEKVGKKAAKGVHVSYNGPEAGSGTTDKDGLYEKTGLTPGTYTWDVTVGGTAYKEYTAHPASGSVSVPADGVGYGLSEVAILNVVTPKITPETADTQAMLVEPEDETTETQIEIDHRFLPDPADIPEIEPIKLTFSFEETRRALKPYKLDGSVVAPGFKMFFDKECTQPFDHEGGAKLANRKLQEGIDLWVKGVTAGDLDVTLVLDPSTDAEILIEEDAVAKVTVKKPVRRLTPKLTPEYLVVMRDRKIWKKQRKDDSKDGSGAARSKARNKPDPIRLLAQVIEGPGDEVYPGQGKLNVPGNITLFKDKELKTPFDDKAKIDFDKLQGAGLTLWMHGVSTGKFNISLELDPADETKFLIDPKAEGELGCVELKYRLYHYTEKEVNKGINPEVKDTATYWDELKGLKLKQKRMKNAEKAKPGRMLHIQDNDKHHQRAKLVVQKITEAHWPDPAKSYELVLDLADRDKHTKTRAGSLKMFPSEIDGADHALPHTLSFGTAKRADKEFWIEGSAISDTWRSVRLSLGMDRPVGGPPKTAKKDGDWAAFTVVKIKEVLCKVENLPGQEKVIDGEKFYINLHKEGRALKSKGGVSKCAVTAELQPALAEVDLHFQVVEHHDIYKIEKAPDALKKNKIQDLKQAIKPVDRPDPKKLLHFTGTTDASGIAKTEDLQAPQIGLAKFKIGAYLLQDPEQARFIDDHKDLKKFEPVLSATWLKVYRRLFFKVFAMQRWSGASYSNRFDEGALTSEMDDLGITMEKKNSSLALPFVPALVEGSGTSGFLDWSRAPFGNAGEREMYLCLISGRHKSVVVKTKALGSPGTKTPSWTISHRMRVKGTASRTDWLDSCNAVHLGTTYDLAAHTTLTQLEDFKFRVSIDATAVWDQIKAANAADVDGGVAKADAFLTGAVITFKWKESQSSSGVSWHEAVVVCMDTREPKHPGQNAKDSATHTFLHEIGHYVGLAAKTLPDKGKTKNPNFYSEKAGEASAGGSGGSNAVIAGERSWGLGPHCDSQTGGKNCLMWHSFKMTMNYCDTCKFSIRTRRLHQPKVAARDDF